MQKNAYKIIALTLLLMLLCGCKQSRSLGERAIVKMVYLDESGGQVQAGLVVFTCAPNSDTASVEGQAKIYTAQGKSIEEALYKAEQQQNKKPFYAQNEILLLGPGAARNVTPYLSYFADENAARPNLAAFLTPLTAEELSECEDVISDVVREGERLIGMGADEQDRTQSIFEINLSGTGGLDGYLPVFSFSKEEKEFRGVRQMVLFRSGAPYAVLEDAAMQMFLLLNGKARQLTVNTQIEGRVVSFRTQQLRLTHTASTAGGALHLEVCLTGKLDDVTVDGAPVADKEEAEMTREINAYLNREAEMLNQATFARGNDTFHYAWWLKLYDTAACEALLRTGTLYDIATVDFSSELKPV